MTDIYITSFFRPEFTLETIRLIRERTEEDTYRIHIYDNGSDMETVSKLMQLYTDGKIASLMLDKRNTGCLYNKGVFHAMTESHSKYYVVSDNDVFPPKLTPDWLIQMINIMEKYPEISLLTPQLPPQGFQMPYAINDDIVLAKAVGNTFKMVRREDFPFGEYQQKMGEYGDDGLISELVHRKGKRVAFCRNIFCYHAGQCENYGYTQEELLKDPRKADYGDHFAYEFANEETYEPEPQWRI
jgi:hypothetical protein